MSARPGPRSLLLIGAGHAHLEVLRAAALQRYNAEVTLISPQPAQRYSGMLGAVVRGEVALAEASIDLQALAARAGVRFVQATVTKLDAMADGVQVTAVGAGGVTSTHEAHVASVDIGGVGTGLDLPGVREVATMLRPATTWDTLFDRVAHWASRPEVTLCVVGGGAVGVEMALAVAARCRSGGARLTMHLVDAGPAPMITHGARAARLARAALEHAGIVVHHNATVRVVTDTHVVLGSGASLPADGVLWATAAAAPPLLRQAGLAVDRVGFLRVGPTLQMTDGRPVFGAGDCVVHDGAPPYARGGANAVRAGRTLAANLRTAVEDSRAPLTPFVPRVAPLALLDTADGAALLTWRGVALHTTWARTLKRRIDQRYMHALHALSTVPQP